MPKPIYVLNGPNLNLLGLREPHIYGTTTLDEVAKRCEATARAAGYAIDFRQTNHEGELVEMVHEARTEAAAVILNAGAYSHTSIALLDALRAVEAPIVECHISNPFARESFRHNSYVSYAAAGIVLGFGPDSYEVALDGVLRLLKQRSKPAVKA